MSELPDGLPNTCIGCDDDVPYVELGYTAWTQLEGNRVKISVEIENHKATMIMSMDELLQPHYEELRKELNE